MKKQLFSKLVGKEWIPFHAYVEKSGLPEDECRKALNKMVFDGKAERLQFSSIFLYAKKGTPRGDVIKAKIRNRLGTGNVHTVKGLSKIFRTDADVIQSLIDEMPDVEKVINRNGDDAYLMREKPPVPEFIRKYPVHHVEKVRKTGWQEFKEHGGWFLGFHVAFFRMAERMRVTMGGFVEPCEFAR